METKATMEKLMGQPEAQKAQDAQGQRTQDAQGLKASNVQVSTIANQDKDEQASTQANAQSDEQDKELEQLENFLNNWSQLNSEQREMLVAPLLQYGYRSNTDIIPREAMPYELFNIIMGSFEVMKDINAGTIIIAPGRSPTWHAKVLQKILDQQKNPCYAFAFSGSPYIKQIPTQEEVKGFREYLTQVGLTPEVLDKAETLCFLDYIETGNSIQSLLMLFAHWKHDLIMGQETEPEFWLKKYAGDRIAAQYIGYRKKVAQLFSICLQKKDLNPAIAEIPIKRINISFNIAGNLYNNLLANVLPAFPCDFWSVPSELRQIILDRTPQAARANELQLNQLLTLIQLAMTLFDKIYGVGTCFELIKIHEDFLPLESDHAMEMTLAQFLTSFLPNFVLRMIAGYPKYLQLKDKIQVKSSNAGIVQVEEASHDDSYDSIADCLFAIWDGQGIDLKKSCRFSQELARQHLGNHPELKSILDLITQLLLELNKLMVIEMPDKKPDSPIVSKNQPDVAQRKPGILLEFDMKMQDEADALRTLVDGGQARGLGQGMDQGAGSNLNTANIGDNNVLVKKPGSKI